MRYHAVFYWILGKMVTMIVALLYFYVTLLTSAFGKTSHICGFSLTVQGGRGFMHDMQIRNKNFSKVCLRQAKLTLSLPLPVTRRVM